jgi:hypothetical protein
VSGAGHRAVRRRPPATSARSDRRRAHRQRRRISLWTPFETTGERADRTRHEVRFADRDRRRERPPSVARARRSVGVAAPRVRISTQCDRRASFGARSAQPGSAGHGAKRCDPPIGCLPVAARGADVPEAPVGLNRRRSEELDRTAAQDRDRVPVVQQEVRGSAMGDWGGSS